MSPEWTPAGWRPHGSLNSVRDGNEGQNAASEWRPQDGLNSVRILAQGLRVPLNAGLV